MLGRKMVGKPAQCQFSTWVRPRKRTPPSVKVSFGKLRKKFFFGGLGGVRFPGSSKVANCQSVEDCKKYGFFRDIDGATPSYLPTSINQPNQNMPHRSELSQDKRQNHQERHQSCLCCRWRNCLLSWDNSDRCGIFWLGWLMDVGRYEGVAPSMGIPSLILANEWELRHLCPKKGA